MNVNVIGQNQMDALNSGAKLSTAKTELQKTSLSMPKEASSEALIKNNRDVFIRTSSKSSYYNSYDESDLNYSYRELTGEQVYSNYRSNSYRAQYATGSDKYRYQALADSYSKEDNVRNALEYTKDIDAVANGKLKAMQENTQYFYDQKDFDFNGDGINDGTSACGATACATMMSLNGKIRKPTDLDVDNNGWIKSWPSGVNKKSYSTKSSFKTAIKNSLKSGKACAIHVGFKNSKNEQSEHWLTVVGVKEGTDLKDAELNDFYVVDPWDSAQTDSQLSLFNETYTTYYWESDKSHVVTM